MAVRWINRDDLPNPDDPFADQMAETASWILYKLTAEKYRGLTETTEWYGRDATNCGSCSSATLFEHVHQEMLNIGAGEGFSRLRLRGTPVNHVSEVSEAGVVLPRESYVIANSGYIMKRDRSNWNLDQGVTVTYDYGRLPPEAGRQAAITLAHELLMFTNGDPNCGFPSGVSSVSRQGVDYAILDPKDFIADGKTGLHSVDLFIHAANPVQARKKPRVFSVNKARGESYR